MRERAEYAAALLLQLLGAACAVLIATRAWQTVTTPRPRPFGDDVLPLSGRTVDAAPTALALVALAGVIAVVATRGWARRAVGAVVAGAGALVVWRALDALAPVSQARAHALVMDKRSGIEMRAVAHIAVHGAWAWLSAACGVLIVAAGVLTAWHGHRWRAMGARYERPAALLTGPPAADQIERPAANHIEPPAADLSERPNADHIERPAADDTEQAQARANAALWSALERGDDPTAEPPRDPRHQ